MTKRKNNAQKPAASQPATIGQDQPPAGEEQAAAGLVVGGGGGTAEADGLQQPAEPLPAGADPHEREQGKPDLSADASVLEHAGGDDGSTDAADIGGIDQPSADLGAVSGLGAAGADGGGAEGEEVTGWPDFIRDDIKFVTALPEEGVAGDQVMTYDAGVYTAFEWIGEPPHWERLAELGTPHGALYGEPAETFFEDNRVQAACVAASCAVFAMRGGDDMDRYMQGFLPREAIVDTSAIIRQIGTNATPEVVGTQLALKGHRPHGQLDPLEHLVLDIFSSTLIKVDALFNAEAAAIAKALEEAERKPPPPVPIEDTTLETVDGPLDTWRV